jgi:hypothetical protein
MEGCGPGTRDPAGLKCSRFRNHIQPVVYISPRIRFGKDRHAALDGIFRSVVDRVLGGMEKPKR